MEATPYSGQLAFDFARSWQCAGSGLSGLNLERRRQGPPRASCSVCSVRIIVHADLTVAEHRAARP
jgi:hypothetical protein